MSRLSGLVAAALPLFVAGVARAADEGGGSTLGLTTLNLVILISVLVYFGRKPIRDFFAERRHRVQHDIASADQLKQDVEARYHEWQRKLADLDAELEQLGERARERADAERAQLLADAQASADRIRREARQAVQQELRRAREELHEEAADLAVKLAGDLLNREVTDADRERLLDEFIERVEGAAGGPNGAGS